MEYDMTMMKVKDLIEQLNKLDPNLELYGYTDDDCLATSDRAYHVFSVESVDESVIESERDSKGRPIFRFSNMEAKESRKVAFINVSTDF